MAYQAGGPGSRTYRAERDSWSQNRQGWSPGLGGLLGWWALQSHRQDMNEIVGKSAVRARLGWFSIAGPGFGPVYFILVYVEIPKNMCRCTKNVVA